MDAEMVLTVDDELQIVMNVFGPHITISYPPYDLTLVRLKETPEGYQFQSLCSPSEIARSHERFQNHGELIGWADVLQCCVASGVVPYTNLSDLKEKITIKQRALSPGNQLFLGLDTNMFYHRFLLNYPVVEPANVLLVSTVIDEIRGHLNRKYDNKGLFEQLKTLVKEKSRLADATIDHLYWELYNRATKACRIAEYFALAEFLRLRGNAVEIKSVEQTLLDSRSNDEIIVKTLQDYQETHPHVDVVLLTADRGIINVCKTYGLDYFLLQVPYEFKDVCCSARACRQLIGLFAVAAGFIKLNATFLLGSFKGQSLDGPLQVKTWFLNETLADEVQRHVMICRKLLKFSF